MVRYATAIWKGSLKEGSGTFGTQSGVIQNTDYNFVQRFGDAPGTNPEELIAAAHAACFSMAFSHQLGERGITPESIETKAEITMEELTIEASHLVCTVKAPGADEAQVREAGEAAEKGCPVSRALNLKISLDLTVNA
jgi:osmotically inducible protein OsmC